MEPKPTKNAKLDQCLNLLLTLMVMVSLMGFIYIFIHR
jgi:hypothetical protein